MKTQRAVSFDESSMESCSLTTTLQDEQRIVAGCGRDSCESCESCESRESRESRGAATTADCANQEVTSLEEAKSVIAALRARQRAQAHQMLAWRRTLKLQEELVARLTREKAEQLRSLSSQLLLFESRLCRKQKEIEANLAQREAIILRQQRVIRQLQNKLRLVGEYQQSKGTGAGGSTPGSAQTRTRDSPPCCDTLDRLDSLGDSDSAVVLEEAFLDDPTPPRFRSNITDVTVIRSVSDAVEPANNKYCASSRRSNGFLRRPEVLETVYSVEEDGDSEQQQQQQQQQRPETANEGQEADEEDNNNDAGGGQSSSSTGDKAPRLRDLYGSFERLAQYEAGQEETRSEEMVTPVAAQVNSQQRTRDESQQAQVTYNRVMSNHRSVTKPKDVKYKRINKAKSKSLEELRGRLRNWVEKGNKIAISLDQSYA
ncbi:uncharacterized protein LOC100121619 isoform X1 [Nasonia vitripennis]|uniref:Uncharacterized protein n=2 Tax=Nasonia vitripennis TaxID=7425 RepID=A0A7M7HDZ1_NASVI|nr:uncharacterized protein LOC100121619 isoform X1 [Nasonia vitripennis]